MIFVISDGREYGSHASYSDVLQLLETQRYPGESGRSGSAERLPLTARLRSIHLQGQGYSDILPKYAYATGGGQFTANFHATLLKMRTRRSLPRRETNTRWATDPKPTTDTSAYRSIEVLVHRKGLKVYAKDGYYPTPVGAVNSAGRRRSEVCEWLCELRALVARGSPE